MTVAPYNQSEMRSHFVDGGDGFQVCRDAVDIFNEQSLTPDKAWPCSWRWANGKQHNAVRNQHVKHPAQDLELGRIQRNSICNGQ
jgi:hypothetical protein